MQRISLGVKADKHGLKKALWKAREIQVKLITDSFQWRDYDSSYHSKESIERSLEQFKESFFNEPKRKLNLNATNATWKGSYVPYLNKLEDIQKQHQLPLDSELFLMVLESYDVCSAARQNCSTVLKKLAKQEKIKLPENWKELSGGYQSLEKEKLKYPSDQEIVELWNKIKNPRWKWVFGMLATYGLRTPEVFFCGAEDLLNESNENNTIEVFSETKTGSRTAYPLKKEWVELFNLKNIQKPNIDTNLENPNRLMNYISRNVSRVFRQYELEFISYSLRHAWAIRSIHNQIPTSAAASLIKHMWVLFRIKSFALELKHFKT